MVMREVFIVGAARTPIGSFQGALASVEAPRLGAAAIQGALGRAGLKAELVGETFMGNVLSAGVGQAPARQAAIYAGVPHKTPATTISKVCGSGLAALLHGARSIQLGENELVVAGGMESMSNAPYILPKARSGYRMGHGEIIDSMIRDGLWDPYGNFHMGQAGETCAREYGFSREQQDAFAIESYRRARAAQERGAFAAEITPVSVAGKGGAQNVESDEEPTRASLDKMASLKPAFAKDGSITAANASKVNDGAAALVLASAEAVKQHGLTPLARVVAHGGHAQAPEWFSTAPVAATRAALARAGLAAKDIDLYEINEAFAVVALACAKDLELSLDRVNVRGGAVALGHPIGASGARIVVTLLAALQEQSARRGVATLCIGGGEALAVVIERV
jgi:acetyl-CoA C-acetyltransferase